MKKRPAQLDGAALLHFTIAPERTDFAVVRYLDTNQKIPISALAICRYNDAPEQVYLFTCDANWTVRGDLLYDSIGEAKSDAERYYETGPLTWHAGEPATQSRGT